MTETPQLPERDTSPWAGRDRFVVLLDDFADGAAFVAWRDRWLADPAGCARLDVIALADATAAPSAAFLRDVWPPATPDLHRLPFDGGGVRLHIAFGPPRRWWRDLVAHVDWFDVSGRDADAFALPKALMRLAAPSAHVALRDADAALLDALRARGFAVVPGPIPGQAAARYAPTFTPRGRPASTGTSPASGRHALIVGAGLAGAATAMALAEEGWRTTVVDRHAAPAGGASGNPAGLFHGIVHADDGPHARLHRAASFEVARAVDHAVAHGVAGSAGGLLRYGDPGADVAQMVAMLDRLRLPAGYVRAVGATEASALAGVAVDRPAWWYPQGGWVDPAGFVRALLARAGAACTFVGGAEVHRVAEADGRWTLHAADGGVIAAGDAVVLANAADAARLLDDGDWPMHAVRGQLSTLPLPAGAHAPHVPLASGGYAMPAVGGRLVFGATAQRHDDDPSLRASDHAHNVEVLNRLLGTHVEADDPRLSGRTAWRCVSGDRLPLIGAVPRRDGASASAPPTRGVPRRAGLFVFTALGSRGITWSVLGGRVVAAAIAGGPSPLPADLLAALDPARFEVRLRAKAAGRGTAAKGAGRVG